MTNYQSLSGSRTFAVIRRQREVSRCCISVSKITYLDTTRHTQGKFFKMHFEWSFLCVKFQLSNFKIYHVKLCINIDPNTIELQQGTILGEILKTS